MNKTRHAVVGAERFVTRRQILLGVGAQIAEGGREAVAAMLLGNAAVVADLDSLTETEVEHNGKRFLLRSTPRPAASLALSALGVALPPTLRQIVDAYSTTKIYNVVPRRRRGAFSRFLSMG